MKIIFTIMFTLSLSILTVKSSAVQSGTTSDDPRGTQIVPNSYATTQAPGTFNGPLATAQRTYQLLIQASQLPFLVGTNITGFNLRLSTNPLSNWPLVDVTYTNFDVYLSESVEPSARSLTFANNIVGTQTQVRSGPLTVLANSYTFGSTPNAFGPAITFNTPWLYAGGNLLVEIRHTGFTGTSRSNEALLTSTPGYGTIVSACWTGNYTGVSGTAGNFAVIKLNNDIQYGLLLKCFIEGLYNSTTGLMVSDTAKVYLRNSFAPYNIVDSAVGVLDGSGNEVFHFLNAGNNVPYYIVVDQRNSITTWSGFPEIFIANNRTYDFTAVASQAYGSNQAPVGPFWALFSGDVNKDGLVDLTDLIETGNDASAFVTGYVPTDVNGDLEVTLQDMLIIYNNSALFVQVISP